VTSAAGPMPSANPAIEAMDEAEALACVKASAAALGLTLGEARARRVAEHLHRTAALAHLLEGFELGVHDEPADVYCPLRRP